MRLKRKNIFLILPTALVILLNVSCMTNRSLYNLAVSRKEFVTPDIISEEYRESKAAWLEEAKPEQVHITSFDGLDLSAWLLEQDPDADRYVILAHGYNSDGFRMVPYTGFYSGKGFNILMPDARGHGNSKGDYIDFGWFSRLDYKQWINFLIQRYGDDIEIVLHGISMGGATVLMTSGEDLPENVKAVISDSAYTSAWDIISYHLDRQYERSIEPVLRSASDLTEKKDGFYFEEASALNQVRTSRIPTLFIHGGADEFVPPEMVYELYDACEAEKELLVVPGADHVGGLSADKAAYLSAVENFLSKYL